MTNEIQVCYAGELQTPSSQFQASRPDSERKSIKEYYFVNLKIK